MPEQDIFKLVEEINKNKKISDSKKIDDIYSLLDKLENGNINITNETTKEKRSTNLSDLKAKTKPIIKPIFPLNIRAYDTRSECFKNIIQAIEYGDTNSSYKEGHEDALEKYYNAAITNNKDFYIVEAMLNEETDSNKRKSKDDFYSRGYRDGLEYVAQALDRSKQLIAQKINDILLKELS